VLSAWRSGVEVRSGMLQGVPLGPLDWSCVSKWSDAAARGIPQRRSLAFGVIRVVLDSDVTGCILATSLSRRCYRSASGRSFLLEVPWANELPASLPAFLMRSSYLRGLLSPRYRPRRCLVDTTDDNADRWLLSYFIAEFNSAWLKDVTSVTFILQIPTAP